MTKIIQQDNAPASSPKAQKLSQDKIMNITLPSAFAALEVPRFSSPRSGSAASGLLLAQGVKRAPSVQERGGGGGGVRETKLALEEPIVEVARAQSLIKALQAKLAFLEEDKNKIKATDSPLYKQNLEYFRKELRGMTSAAEILKSSALPLSELGTYSALFPADPGRPRLLISFSMNELADVDKTTEELRDAVTKEISWRLTEQKKTRPNSILIVKAPEVLDRELAAANVRLETVLALAAAKAIADSTLKREEILRDSQGVAKAVLQLAGENTRLFACEKAAEFKRMGEEKGWPVHLLGYQTDFENKRKTGVEYSVITSEGKTYSMSHIGKNFQDKHGQFVPKAPWAALNVALIRCYDSKKENKSISRSDLYRIAVEKGFCPTEDGKITYLDQAKLNRSLSKVCSELSAIYAKKKGITSEELKAVLDR